MPSFGAWEAASELHSFHQDREHYSTLHKVVDDGMEQTPQEEETTMILVGTAQSLWIIYHSWLRYLVVHSFGVEFSAVSMTTWASAFSHHQSFFGR